MTYNQIQKLIPFVDENFVTFPLVITEGVYIPFYNFWQSLSTRNDLKIFIRKATSILKDTGYEIKLRDEEDVHIHNYGETDDMKSTIVNFQIYPICKTDDDDVFVNVDPLSFDVDAIDLLIKIISK